MFIIRTRLAIFLISLAVIGLELALMRILSLRFWYYFASMVISVALLGFGSSGTALTLLQTRLAARRQLWLCLLAFAFALSVSVSVWAGQKVPLDVYYLAWNLRGEWLHILAIECSMLVPFFLAGGLIGLALMDRPERINGHYAANLIGSGVGAILTILLMHLVRVADLPLLMAALGYLAAIILLPWNRVKAVLTALTVGIGLMLLAWHQSAAVVLSPYKKLALEKAKPQTEVIYKSFGPMGRIDVVKGPAIHDAPPGMSLLNPHPIPSRSLLIVDGDQTNIIYNARGKQDWGFLDYTTDALSYHLSERPNVLIIGAGGGGAIGLALLHQSREIVALEMNRQIIQAMRGPLTAFGGRVYEAPRVEIRWQEARGFLTADARRFDIIQLPLLDVPGTSAGGVGAARESYEFTVETFAALFDHLSSTGILSATVYAKNPPRDGLRVFDLAGQALRGKGIEPATHLALIRSWETVSLLISKPPWTSERLDRIRSFCQDRGFDLCYLPDLQASEVNQFHFLDEPTYVEGSQALLGSGRRAFLNHYVFTLEAPTDDRPYFHHFFRWRTLPALKERLKGSLPAFLELGSLLLVIALIQAVLLAAVMIFLPLVPGIRPLRKVGGKAVTVSYFFLLGIGFMLLEMGFLQKLILYLSHPIYSAAVVIATFLVFGGLGSQLSGRWRQRPRTAAVVSAGMIVTLSLGYLTLMDSWLALTQSWSLWWRLLVAGFTVAPLALAMGHLFPMGLKRLGQTVPAFIPWAWAVNGFASVIATVSAPLLAMNVGFSRVIITAMVCYAVAGSLFPRLPGK